MLRSLKFASYEQLKQPKHFFVRRDGQENGRGEFVPHLCMENRPFTKPKRRPKTPVPPEQREHPLSWQKNPG
jgi:hypothetical protein